MCRVYNFIKKIYVLFPPSFKIFTLCRDNYTNYVYYPSALINSLPMIVSTHERIVVIKRTYTKLKFVNLIGQGIWSNITASYTSIVQIFIHTHVLHIFVVIFPIYSLALWCLSLTLHLYLCSLYYNKPVDFDFHYL